MAEMIFREAQKKDIPQIQVVRNAVKENTLSDPALVTDKDCEDHIIVRGKGWVCETGNTIVGFSIVDLMGHEVWALFVTPGYEAKGIGKKLHNLMLDWYFSKTAHTIWLGTASDTRAEQFYNICGWKEVERKAQTRKKDHSTWTEIKFEMTANQWRHLNERAFNNYIEP
ncbi:MAG: GNAT family N-acetyltransferase [Panacibacter sp.]